MGVFFFPVLVFLVLAMFLFAGYLLLGGAGRIMDRLRDETGPRFLENAIPTLLLWNPSRAFPDMSSLCRRTRHSSGLGGGRSHSRGTVQSLRNGREAWLAFAVNTRSRLGCLAIYTTENKLEFHVKAKDGRGGGRHALIVADGEPFGMMDLGTRELLDPQGRPVGRLTGGLSIRMGGMPSYQVLNLGGEDLAGVNQEPLSPLTRLGPMPPAFQLYRTDLTEKEQWWLLASFAAGLYQDSLSSGP